jgi:hypothetical protein
MWMTWFFVLLILLVFLPTTVLLLGISRWQLGTIALRGRLEAARRAIEPKVYSVAELEGLPAPVQGYFRAVLKDGQPLIAAVELTQEGRIELGRPQQTWTSCTASQSVMLERPGFDWDARVRVAPGSKVFVHDAYVEGVGLLKAALFGLIPLAKVPGSPELAEAQLMRFLAEAPLYPTRLLPSQGVSWASLDGQSARATLTDAELTVTLDFTFDDAGLITRVYSPGRYRAAAGALVQTPWEALFSEYQERSGLLVPTRGEVAWLLPQGRLPYWRGQFVEVLYKFAS